MVPSRRLRLATSVVAGVEQGEAAGAVGRFHHARRKAGLPHGRRLLVARDAEDRDLAPEQVGAGRAEVGGAIAHLGQHRQRHAEVAADLVVPVARRGCCRAACARRWWRRSRAPGPPVSFQIRKLSTVPKSKLALSRPARGRLRHGRAATRPWCPRNRGRAAGRCAAVTIGSSPASFSCWQRSAVRRSCQTMALWIGWPVSRSQISVVSRWLVMPMAAMSAAEIPAFSMRRARGARDGGPEVLRVMLDPAGGRVDLREFFLRGGHHGHRAIEQDRPRRGGALVDGEDVGHGVGP